MINLHPAYSSSDFSTDDLTQIVNTVNTVISVVLGLLTAAIVILAIGLAYKFFSAEDDGKRKNAKQQLIYAIIGVIVLIALLIAAPLITEAVKGAITKE